ncbi:hypothetical protein PS691_05812 [Pseudomonas fluorescens]|uniref:Uncharacterized protein n=1 Tax=Pseudomonas fluorescens TaxID=294 RepID=A0A5E7FSS7_PSEFL|nr:hypothetical protein PS691_05812 [Pseudomonas fluorescens]
MVHGQPADEHVLRPHFQSLAHGAQIGQQIGVADHHALGLARAARGVLQEGEVLRLPRRCDALAPLACQLAHCGNARQARDLRLEQPGEQLRLLHGDQHLGLGVAQDAGLAVQMILDLRQAQRWVDGHRHPPGQQDAKKAMEKVAPCGQHQGHGLTGLQATALQPGGNGPGCLVQGAIADVLRLVTFTQQAHVGKLRLMAHMPLQHLDQGPRSVRRLRRCYRGLAGVAGGQWTYRLGAMAAVQHMQYIGGSVRRGEQGFRQAHSEFVLDARPEFDPGQTVYAQVPVQHAVQGDLQTFCRLRAQLDHGALDNFQQFFCVPIGMGNGGSFWRRTSHRRPLMTGHAVCRSLPIAIMRLWRRPGMPSWAAALAGWVSQSQAQPVATGEACVRLRSSRKIRCCGIPEKPSKQDSRLLRSRTQPSAAATNSRKTVQAGFATAAQPNAGFGSCYGLELGS